MGQQLFLFRRVNLGKTTISFLEKPFPHIRVENARGSLMLPIEELLRAGRMIDGLTPLERKLIRKIVSGLTFKTG